MDNSMTNNMEYFNALHKVFGDKTIMRKFFEELMTRDISSWDPINDRPITELAQDMQAMNTDPYTCFAAYMLENYEEVSGKKYSGAQLYQKFKEWWTTSGRNSEHKPNSQVFGTKIKNQKCVISKRTKKGMAYEFVEEV